MRHFFIPSFYHPSFLSFLVFTDRRTHLPSPSFLYHGTVFVIPATSILNMHITWYTSEKEMSIEPMYCAEIFFLVCSFPTFFFHVLDLRRYYYEMEGHQFVDLTEIEGESRFLRKFWSIGDITTLPISSMDANDKSPPLVLPIEFMTDKCDWGQ